MPTPNDDLMKNIGQEKTVQNPTDALPGTYKDAVESMSEADKLPTSQLPMAPAPPAFGNLSSPAKGSR